MPTRTIRRLTITHFLSLLFLAAAGAGAIVATGHLVRDTTLISRTYDARSTLREFTAAIEGAKADIRGFLLTGDSSYLNRMNSGMDSASGVLSRLLTLANGEQETRRELGRITPLLRLRQQKLQETVRLSVHDSASLRQRLREGEAIAGSIGAIVDSVDRREAAQLAARVAAGRRSQQLLTAGVVLLFAIASAVLLALRWSMLRDLRERTRYATKLEASEARFAGILAIAGDAIVSVDRGRRIVHFNHAAEDVFGWPADEAIGQPLDILIPRSSLDRHEDHVARFEASGIAARRMGERQRVSGRRRDGSEFPADVSISRLQTPEGPVMTAVIRDITGQRRIEHHEHTLAVAGARLGSTLDHDAMVTLVTDLAAPSIGEWCILDVGETSANHPATIRRVVSHHADAARHAALQDIGRRGIDWDSPSEVIDIFRSGEPALHRTIDPEWLERHTSSEAEIERFNRLGTRSLLSVPLRVRDRVTGVLTIGNSARALDEHDLMLATAFADQAARALDNARLYARAERARAARDEVLAVVSHDLRTPASAVAMCARALLDHPPEDPEERRRLYATMLESSEWMYRLIQDLLDAASIDAGRLSVDLASVSAESLAANAAEVFAARIAAAGLSVVIDVEPALPPVRADAERIRQVLGNLITNAVRFTSAGGTVTISAARHADDVLIAVGDSGVGIPPEQLPHVFDRFWHAGSIGRGSGLGLAIAAGIISAHGGLIWVESEVGRGSTFFFTLPAATTLA